MGPIVVLVGKEYCFYLSRMRIVAKRLLGRLHVPLVLSCEGEREIIHGHFESSARY